MREVRLSQGPLIKVLLAAVGLWILIQILQQALWVLIVILLAIILASAVMPAVNLTQRLRLPPRGWRLPKALVVIAIYILVAAAIAALGFFVGRLLVGQLLGFAEEFPALVEEVTAVINRFAEDLGFEVAVPSPEQAAQHAQDLAGGVAGLIAMFFEGFLTFVFRLVLVLILALFIVSESDRLISFAVSLFPPAQREKAYDVATGMGEKIGYWVLGQILVAVSVGILAGLAMFLLDMPYPLVIGVMTTVLDLAPAVGPSVMVLPVFLLGLTESPEKAIIAGLVFLALSELDAHVFTPLITGRIVRLSRVFIFVAVIMGLALFGPIGALMAIPVAASLQVFTIEVLLPWLRRRQGVPEEEIERELGENVGGEGK
jgi:predicted PurR-regulated permease PerM